MAGKNRVTLTFAGDSDQLQKAFSQVGSSADQMQRQVTDASERVARSVRDSTDRISRSARDQADSFDRAREGFDTIDTRAMGYRDTLTGVEDSMASMNAFQRGEFFEGFLLAGFGVGDLASGMVNNLIPALKSVRTGMGNVVSFLTGPWGAAIGAGAILVTGFVSAIQESRRNVETLTDSLDEQTGAITRHTRTVIAQRLEQEGALEQARDYGIRLNDLIDAILGERDAIVRVNDAIQGNIRLTAEQRAELTQNETVLLSDLLLHEELSEELGIARQRWERLNEAVSGATDAADENTAAIEAQLDSLKELSDTLKAQVDPVFGFVDAQRRLRDAQAAVNEAQQEFGAGSRQHQDALLDLAEAELGLVSAASQARDAVGGELIPVLEQMRDDGLLSQAAFRELRESIDEAADAARDADGTVVRITERFTQVRRVVDESGFRVPQGTSLARQHGGPASGMTLVGEHGRELLELPPGSFVHSNPRTEAMMAATGQGMAAGGGHVTLTVAAGRGGTSLEQAFAQAVIQGVRSGAISLKVSNGRVRVA